MSYYKYAERSAESRVDWNEISKGMVDMLKEQTRLRNEKLDEAVKLQGEVTTTLSDAPMGSDTNANQRVSQFAADAQEYSLMMSKLWRSGEMSYREYMAATNNFKTNTEGYLGQAEKYAANYEKHVKRMEEQLASGVEVSELARVEDFGNFSRFTPVIDAPTGSIGLVGEDGKKYASVSQLGVAVMSQYDRLDVEGRTTAVAEQMGKTVNVIKAGGVRTLESALQNPDYVAAENDAVSGIMIGDNAHTSVLVDFKRGLYSTTHDINDAINDPNAILMVPSSRNSDRMIGAVEDDADFERYIDEQATRDGQPLTPGEKATLRRHRDAQREESFEAVRDQLRARLPFVETPTADTSGDSDAARKARERAKREARMVTNWDVLGTGTPEDQTVAAEAIVGMLNEGKEADERIVDRIVPDADGQRVTFFYPDGTSRNVSLVDEEGNRLSRSQWLSEGTEFHGVEGDYGRFYEGGIVPAGSTVLERGERTVGYEEPAVDYNTETQGFDPATGKLIEVTPRSSYVASTEANSSSKSVTSAALGALSSMNFSDPQVSVLEIDRINDIDLPGTQSVVFGNRFEDAVMYFVPGVMPYQVFVPEEGGAAVVGRLNELVSEARKQDRQVTIEELKAAIGVNNYDIYNTQDMRDANPVEVEQVENPNVTSGASSGGNVR